MRDRVRDVDGVGEAAREVHPVDLVGLDAQSAQQDALAAGVGGLGLGELARRRSRENVMPAPGATVTRRARPAKRPSAYIQPIRRSSARMSTRPEPQMPSGSASPMVRYLEALRPSMRTDSMAPSAPGMPKRRRPPSKAGPAGQDAARSRVAVGDDDLGVRADVDEQVDARPLAEVDRRRGPRRRPRRRGSR